MALLRWGGNVLNHTHTDREDLAEEADQSQFPLPACSGRWWQFFLALLAVLTWFATRGLAVATSPTHSGRIPFRIFDAIPGLGLNVEIGMRSGNDAIPLPFRAGIYAHRDGLRVPRGWFDIEPHTEDPPFPEGSSFA
ncbi:MAG TPA: hypothetical protein VEH81_14240, partial [Ktedonobacteraceae bacterium]|nr:hypothetical protein [Ktedonobacteraceae bacterium]